MDTINPLNKKKQPESTLNFMDIIAISDNRWNHLGKLKTDPNYLRMGYESEKKRLDNELSELDITLADSKENLFHNNLNETKVIHYRNLASTYSNLATLAILLGDPIDARKNFLSSENSFNNAIKYADDQELKKRYKPRAKEIREFAIACLERIHRFN